MSSLEQYFSFFKLRSFPRHKLHANYINYASYNIDIIQAPMAQVVSMLTVVQVLKVAGSNPNRGKKYFFVRSFRVSINPNPTV